VSCHQTDPHEWIRDKGYSEEALEQHAFRLRTWTIVEVRADFIRVVRLLSGSPNQDKKDRYLAHLYACVQEADRGEYDVDPHNIAPWKVSGVDTKQPNEG
jgi:hypothetical protein